MLRGDDKISAPEKREMSLLLSFLVGSSWAVSLPWFLRAARIPPERWRYDYRWYTIVAPPYFGIMSVLAVLLRPHMGFYGAYALVGALSALIVTTLAIQTRAYPYPGWDPWRYAIRIFFLHMVTYVLIVGTLDRLVVASLKFP